MSNASIEKIVCGMTHTIQSPLSAIATTLTAIREGYMSQLCQDDEKSKMVQKGIDNVVKDSRKISLYLDIIETIVTVDNKWQSEKVNLKKVLASISEEYRSSINYKDIDLSIVDKCCSTLYVKNSKLIKSTIIAFIWILYKLMVMSGDIKLDVNADGKNIQFHISTTSLSIKQEKLMTAGIDQYLSIKTLIEFLNTNGMVYGCDVSNNCVDMKISIRIC